MAGDTNYTLYLCKMDLQKRNAKGEPSFVAVIGRAVYANGGYRFLPNTSAHKPSRKLHNSIVDCIPAWTERYGFLQLLDQRELAALSQSEPS